VQQSLIDLACCDILSLFVICVNTNSAYYEVGHHNVDSLLLVWVLIWTVVLTSKLIIIGELTSNVVNVSIKNSCE
jgi:ABC-type antimicrobial peptide transport system permease subunit